jgi:signal transduction histidine kinase
VRLPDFIYANTEAIVAEWLIFARTRLPAAASMSELALKDEAVEILAEIVEDMGGKQTAAQQKDKSQERGAPSPGAERASAAHSHAQQRAHNGFETIQLVSEFRALRATVLRLWNESEHKFGAEDLEDVTRFNESVDEALAASLKAFVKEEEHRRHLFIGVLGHDLRGPLHTIMNCAKLTMRKTPTSAREAGMILRSAAQIKALADDLLEFTLSGLCIGAPIVPVPMQLDQFCRQTLDEVATISAGRVIELRVDGDMKGAWDNRRMHQLFWNLVINALKYGTEKRPIAVALDGIQADLVKLSVHNFGNPISPAIMPNLFAPLVRGSLEDVGSPVPAGANMGLGLYIVNTIVKAHSGTIQVTSNDEEGTRFLVSLPRYAGNPGFSAP